jgi:hypothetical protein
VKHVTQTELEEALKTAKITDTTFKLANGLPARIILLTLPRETRMNIWTRWTVAIEIDQYPIYLFYPGNYPKKYIIWLCQSDLNEALTQSVLVLFDQKLYVCSETNRKAVLNGIKAKVSPYVYPLLK